MVTIPHLSTSTLWWSVSLYKEIIQKKVSLSMPNRNKSLLGQQIIHAIRGDHLILGIWGDNVP